MDISFITAELRSWQIWYCGAAGRIAEITKWSFISVPPHEVVPSWLNDCHNVSSVRLWAAVIKAYDFSILWFFFGSSAKTISSSHAEKPGCIFCTQSTAAYSCCIKDTVLSLSVFFCFFRKTTKESLAESASNITESLMSISRMMSQQVQQSEETVQTLGTDVVGVWGVGWVTEEPFSCSVRMKRAKLLWCRT